MRRKRKSATAVLNEYADKALRPLYLAQSEVQRGSIAALLNSVTTPLHGLDDNKTKPILDLYKKLLVRDDLQILYETKKLKIPKYAIRYWLDSSHSIGSVGRELLRHTINNMVTRWLDLLVIDTNSYN
jgi:hypothetical protein